MRERRVARRAAEERSEEHDDGRWTRHWLTRRRKSPPRRWRRPSPPTHPPEGPSRCRPRLLRCVQGRPAPIAAAPASKDRRAHASRRQSALRMLGDTCTGIAGGGRQEGKEEGECGAIERGTLTWPRHPLEGLALAKADASVRRASRRGESAAGSLRASPAAVEPAASVRGPPHPDVRRHQGQARRGAQEQRAHAHQGHAARRQGTGRPRLGDDALQHRRVPEQEPRQQHGHRQGPRPSWALGKAGKARLGSCDAWPRRACRAGGRGRAACVCA